jgi:restriction system protein
MARRNESFLDLLLKSPWWISVGLSILSYTGLTYVLPQTASHNLVLKSFAEGMPAIAPFVSLVLLVPAAVSLVNSWRKRKLFDGQRDLQTIRSLSWREFEELVGEAYRRLGYAVKENSGPGPDGGVDLTLRKAGELVLVQCKQWRTMKVGVKTIRELYGVMTAKHASSGTAITSGTFTHEARLFAINKPIELVDGRGLSVLVGDIQRKGVPTESNTETKACPECGARMVKRVARRGSHAREAFWGCSAFPDCRVIVPLSPVDGRPPSKLEALKTA